MESVNSKRPRLEEEDSDASDQTDRTEEEDSELVDDYEILEGQFETDLKDYQLGKVWKTLDELKEKMSESRGGRKRMDHKSLQVFVDKSEEVRNVTTIPKEMTLEDYVIRLDPPNDNKVYNDAVADIERQIAARSHCLVKLECPFGCTDLHLYNLAKVKKHIQMKHLKLKSFQWVNCGSNYGDYSGLRKHICSKHLDLKFQCDGCKMKLGPRRQIRMKMYDDPKDIEESRGFTYQIYGIPWMDKKGNLVNILLDLQNLMM